MTQLVSDPFLTSDEIIAGKEVYELRDGQRRPSLDEARYGCRTRRYDLSIFSTPRRWRAGIVSLWQIMQSSLIPNVLWLVGLASGIVGGAIAAGQTVAAVLVLGGWQFEHIGLVALPSFLAVPFVWLLGGYMADWTSNRLARYNGGVREPEAHLLSLFLPILLVISGFLTFGTFSFQRDPSFSSLSTCVSPHPSFRDLAGP